MTNTPITSSEDNSFGLGYFPVPARLRGLGRFADALKAGNLVSIKVFPRDGIWMLRARVDSRFSIMAQDMVSLLAEGLTRTQCNEPGTLDFYFQDEKLV